jgi:hypothetical protein
LSGRPGCAMPPSLTVHLQHAEAKPDSRLDHPAARPAGQGQTILWSGRYP